jgi:hypothetical protein
MGHRVFCLECSAVVGEEFEGAEAERGDRLSVCQTCAQHRPPAAAVIAASALAGVWRWLAGPRA